jgi:hypothetical protein
VLGQRPTNNPIPVDMALNRINGADELFVGG